MSTLRVTFTPSSIGFEIDDQSGSIPVGPYSLADDLRHDPPHAEELSNALGLVLDHMEDIEREVPAAMFAERVEVCGAGVDVVAAVEIGGAAELPFALERDAAEDVFRTLVTEPARDRALNPGLPADAVHTVLGTVSALVGVMRFLRATEVWVVSA